MQKVAACAHEREQPVARLLGAQRRVRGGVFRPHFKHPICCPPQDAKERGVVGGGATVGGAGRELFAMRGLGPLPLLGLDAPPFGLLHLEPFLLPPLCVCCCSRRCGLRLLDLLQLLRGGRGIVGSLLLLPLLLVTKESSPLLLLQPPVLCCC